MGGKKIKNLISTLITVVLKSHLSNEKLKKSQGLQHAESRRGFCACNILLNFDNFPAINPFILSWFSVHNNHIVTSQFARTIFIPHWQFDIAEKYVPLPTASALHYYLLSIITGPT